jgi:hypothetical protein
MDDRVETNIEQIFVITHLLVVSQFFCPTFRSYKSIAAQLLPARDATPRAGNVISLTGDVGASQNSGIGNTTAADER